MFTSRVSSSVQNIHKNIRCLLTTAKMSSTTTQNPQQDLKPPPGVRNMQTLQKSLFLKQIQVPYLTVEPSNVSKIMKAIKKYLLKLERFRPVKEENKLTIIILNPLQVNNFTDLDELDRTTLATNGITNDNFKFKELELTFDNYSVEDIFRSVLPTEKEGMASFTKIGHIVHVNLRDHLLPFKNLIGDVLLNKVAACRTVVNKINIIDNTYRNFKMEVLAGEEDYMVTLKENRCTFEFDFATVYWNSRLCTEHERIVNIVKKGEVLFDVFAGVGPFSIPVSKNGGLVWANDLNPESFKWLQHNAKKNKIGDNLKMFNKDGKDFIVEDIKRELIKVIKEEKVVHITMNLPALASEFLKFFEGLYKENDFVEVKNFKAPTVYLYCFAKGEETEEITNKLVNDCMNRDMSKFIKELFSVRTVSNFKEMMRVKICLEKEILLGKYEHQENVPSKRKGEELFQEDISNNKKCTNYFHCTI